MSLYKRQNSPNFYCKFYLHKQLFRFNTGFSATERNRKKALAFEKKKKAELHHKYELHSVAGTVEMPIEDILDKYWDDHARHLKTAKTGDLRAKIDRLLPHFVDVTSSNLQNFHVAEYVTWRKNKKYRGREISGGTINRETQILRAALNMAERKWDVVFGKKINWPAHRQDEPVKRHWALTDEQQVSLVRALRDDYRPLFFFCLLTGSRVTPARELTWRDIDFDKEKVVLRNVKSKLRGVDHTIPLFPRLRTLLETQLANNTRTVFTWVRQEGRNKGKRYPFSKDGWKRPWKLARIQAGVEGFRWHDLRHTTGQRLADQFGIHVAKDVLGHADIATTQRYVDTATKQVADALQGASQRRLPAAPGEDNTRSRMPL